MDRGTLIERTWADKSRSSTRTMERSVATYDDPDQYATGISTVVENGEVVIDEAEHTGTLPGRVLRRPGQWRWLALGAASSTGSLGEKSPDPHKTGVDSSSHWSSTRDNRQNHLRHVARPGRPAKVGCCAIMTAGGTHGRCP